MNQDTYGEILNGEETYKEIAGLLLKNKSILVGWTDQKGSHFDILFVLNPEFFGTNIQGGLRQDDLFVGVMRRGIFGFIIKDEDTHYGYIGEKLNMRSNITTEKLAELINGVKKELVKIEEIKKELNVEEIKRLKL